MFIFYWKKENEKVTSNSFLPKKKKSGLNSFFSNEVIHII